ncbi:hypothetical protein OUZ56_005968 [Daphnia magna]|uniref:Uncharacterized protein n=1 Tax=Daphnia magna TaxID=35525 RepID=A0ABQ9YUG5_9CRUS|nr:hypothetical protein OUZ56_005968 [Daphnia magna]
MVKEVEDNVSWQKSDAMAVPIPARVVAILIGAMATAIKTGVTAVITKMVASATEEKAEKTTRNLLSSSSRSGCLQQWLSFSNDQWILSTVVHGYVIDFLEPPVQHSTPSGCIISKEMETVCVQEANTSLGKGAIRPVIFSSSDGFISNMFSIPKKSGGWRQIII